MRALAVLAFVLLCVATPVRAEAQAACCAPADLQCMIRMTQHSRRKPVPIREWQPTPMLVSVYRAIAATVSEWWAEPR